MPLLAQSKRCTNGRVRRTKLGPADAAPKALGSTPSRWALSSSWRRWRCRATSRINGRAMLKADISARWWAVQGSANVGCTGCRFASSNDRTCTLATKACNGDPAASLPPGRQVLASKASASANAVAKSERSPTSPKKRGAFVKSQSTILEGSVLEAARTSSGTKYKGGRDAFGISSSGGNCRGSRSVAVRRRRFAMGACPADSATGKSAGGSRLQYSKRPKAWKIPSEADRSPVSLASPAVKMQSLAALSLAPPWGVGSGKLFAPRPRLALSGLPTPRRVLPPPAMVASLGVTLNSLQPTASCSAFKACRRSPPHSAAMAGMLAAVTSTPSTFATASKAR
mmetsp:Transcript_5604/g.17224  ORF Transcript_5604/g.17224 Transcript_5604/m.17224 type:complete len:341 (+) Transcript_5604:421-1443(+)